MESHERKRKRNNQDPVGQLDNLIEETPEPLRPISREICLALHEGMMDEALAEILEALGHNGDDKSVRGKFGFILICSEEHEIGRIKYILSSMCSNQASPRYFKLNSMMNNAIQNIIHLTEDIKDETDLKELMKEKALGLIHELKAEGKFPQDDVKTTEQRQYQ